MIVMHVHQVDRLKRVYHTVNVHQCCSVLQCVAVCCSVLQCVAVCCSVLQCVAVTFIRVYHTVNVHRVHTLKKYVCLMYLCPSHEPVIPFTTFVTVST